MAVIGEIRKRSGLVLVMVGGALVAFIMTDAFKNGPSQGDDRRVGEIFGTDVTNIEFQTRVENEVDNRTGFGGTVTEDVRAEIRNQVWSEIVRERVMDPELDELGLSVPIDEFFDMIDGENIHQSLAGDPSFQNQETGQYDPNLALTALKNFEETSPVEYQSFKRRLMIDRKFVKYHNMIKKGMYATQNEAFHDYHSTQDKVNFNFVIKKYTSIPDSIITYNDADVQAYYDAHKTELRFKQNQETRGIEYVKFSVVPSKRDTTALLRDIDLMIEAFKNAYDDSAYASENTDAQVFNGYENYTPGTMQGELDSMMMQADSGAVVGPYQNAGVFKVSKVYGFGDSYSKVRASHILLKITDGDTAKVEARIDSIKTAIERGADFAEMAQKFSEGPSSTKGGDLDYFVEGQMVPPFNDACFNGKVGDMPIVTTDFGIHLIKIVDQVKGRKIVSIDRNIVASDATADSVFSAASAFAINNDDAAKFDAGVEASGYTSVPADNLYPDLREIQGVANSRKVITWAFGAEEGDVSETFDLGNSFLVAKMNVVREEGVPELDAIRPNIENAVIREKKAEMYAAQMMGATDLQTIADKVGEPVLPAENITFSSLTIPGGGGNEPKVIGQIFSLTEGTISQPLQGETGVYVVQVQSFSPVEEPTDNYASNKSSVMLRMVSRVDYEVFGALQKQAGVKDERSRLY